MLSSSKRARTHYKPIAWTEHEGVDGEHFGCSDAERYWMDMEEAAVFEAQGNVTSCDFSPLLPPLLASTSGKEMTTFDARKCEPKTIYSKFKERTNSAKFRADGSLLGVTTHAGELMFFDTQSESQQRHWARNAIRTLHAHRCAVNAFCYDRSGRKVFSLADDGRTKLFDLAAASSADGAMPLWECEAHADAIRTGVESPTSEHILVTGSYDHTVKLWDIRTDGAVPVKQFDHGAPVERVLYIRNDDILASAGASTVKIWDLNTGKLLANIENHNKTVTSLCLANDGACLLTGGIDRRVNVVRLDDNGTYAVLHSMRLEWPVLSLAVSPDDSFLAFGMPNRLALHRRQPQKTAAVNGTTTTTNGGGMQQQNVKRKKPKNVKGFDEQIVAAVADKQMEGKNGCAEAGGKTAQKHPAPRIKMEIVQRDRILGTESVAMELTEQQLDKLSLGTHDRLLRQGAFKELVGKMLRNAQAPADLVVATFGQIRIRNCLDQALADHDKQELKQLFLFLRRNLFVASYFDILYDVATVAIDIYAGKPLQKDVRSNIKLLEAQISQEVHVQEVLCETIGALRMVLHWNEMKNKKAAADTMENGAIEAKAE
uniref:U3 small nucleolar RNA-associated protein 15 homolog n=1 Tax=Globodera pallida TaxID=36090 RepID=A0A183C4G0_GLOPA